MIFFCLYTPSKGAVMFLIALHVALKEMGNIYNSASGW